MPARRAALRRRSPALAGLALARRASSGRSARPRSPADVRQVGWGLLADHRDRRPALPAARARLAAVPRSAAHAVGLRDAFAAVVCGDAIGNLTPLGPLVGEPAKAAFVRQRVPLGAGAHRARDRERALHAVGRRDDRGRHGRAAGALPAAAAIRGVGELAIAGTFVLFAARAVAAVAAAGADQPRARRRAALRATPTGSGSSRRRSTPSPRATAAPLPALAAAEVGFHALGVAEIYLTLWLLNDAPPALLDRVHVRNGQPAHHRRLQVRAAAARVDEAATALLTPVLGLGAKSAPRIAIVRKVRMLFWASPAASSWCARGRTQRVRRGRGFAVAPGPARSGDRSGSARAPAPGTAPSPARRAARRR